MISLSIIHNFNRSDIYPKPFFFILEFHVKPLCVSRGWLFFSFFFFFPIKGQIVNTGCWTLVSVTTV